MLFFVTKARISNSTYNLSLLKSTKSTATYRIAMAKIFRLCAEYHQAQPQTGWTSLLRYFTRQPAWKRVSKYDNVLRDIMEPQPRRQRKPLRTTCPTGIRKRTSIPRSSSAHSASSPLPNHAVSDSSWRRKHHRMDALAHMLLSRDFLNDVNSVLHSHKMLLRRTEQCNEMRKHMSDLRGQADRIEQNLVAAQDREDSEVAMVKEGQMAKVEELRSEALEIASEFKKISAENNNGRKNFTLKFANMAQKAAPYLEQAGLLQEMDEQTIGARLFAPPPENDLFPPPKVAKETANPQTGEAKDEQLSAAEQQAKEGLRRARRAAFLSYLNTDNKLEAHRTTYPQQLNRHRNGINPGWPEWDPAWNDEAFDVQHLRQAMRYSTEIREAEEALSKAMQEANNGGVSPMVPWQMSGFNDRPDDNPADSVREFNGRNGVGAWADQLPSLPPNPEPFGPGVVQYPSDQMAELDHDVEIWETWSLREEDVRRKTLIEKRQQMS